VGRTYYPRFAATMVVPSLLDSERVYRLPLLITSAALSRNDHRTADELTLKVAWQNIGLDARLVKDASIFFHWGNVGNPDEEFVPTTTGGRTGAGNCRFAGTVTGVEATAGEGEPYEVTLQARDHTGFFLRAKPFGSKGIPAMSDTLEQAWRKVVSQTPGAEHLSDAIAFHGVNGSARLSDLVGSRFAKLSQVPARTGSDAWGVWQEACGMAGLISFFLVNTCIVTRAESFYRTNDPPVFAWGENIANMVEHRNTVDFNNGVGVTSFDPLSGRMLEAVFPPRSKDDSRNKKSRGRRRLGAVKQLSSAPEAKVVDGYDWWALSGVHTVGALQDYAKAAYLERSKQELQGQLTTADWSLETAGGAEFDFLDLVPGDNVQVFGASRFPDGLKDKTPAEREAYLAGLGIDPEAAALIQETLGDAELRDPTFYVKGFRAHMSSEDVKLDLFYCNRVLVGRDSD